MKESKANAEYRNPTLFQALFPILILVVLLTTNVIVMGTDAMAGPNQVGLLIAAAVAGIISVKLGCSWKEIESSMLKSINSAMGAILILLMIGALSGTWLLSGIVPAMIYYGVKILNPTIFLIAACIVCSVTSIATGSSWTTVATIGIALLGIGKALGFHEGIIAGAIISGAYFGDKVSPFSDTTNLAAAMAGTELFVHIRYLMYTTLPTILITLIILGIWGINLDIEDTGGQTNKMLRTIEEFFSLNPALLIVPLVVIYMIIKKIPALPALFAGALLGGIFAVILQPQAINQVSGIDDDYLQSSFIGVMKAMTTTIQIKTENEIMDTLLISRGMFGMLNTIWIILCAMIFGGIMESSGLLHRIVKEVIRFAHSTGSLIASTTVTCIIFNITASDQYMSVAIPGRMYSKIYRERNLKSEVLSRTLEDSGTVTSVLVPWNTCGATQSSVLGISTMVYAPFTFFCIISPFMTVLQGYLNFKIRKLVDHVQQSSSK